MTHLSQMRRDAHDMVDPWYRNPTRQLRRNGLGLVRCFYPHRINNNFRKLTTIVLFAVWATLTLGVVPTPNDNVYLAITILCFLILGQQWEIEKLRIGGMELRPHTQSEDKSDD